MQRYVAGSREPREVVHVDYADVLRQAVQNERWNVLRELRQSVERVKDHEARSNSYGTDPRRGPDVKRDILATIDRMLDARGVS